MAKHLFYHEVNKINLLDSVTKKLDLYVVLFMLTARSIVMSFFTRFNGNFCIFVQQILGKTVKRSSILDKKLQWELKSLAEPDDPYPTLIGKTVCTSDFYEGMLSNQYFHSNLNTLKMYLL